MALSIQKIFLCMLETGNATELGRKGEQGPTKEGEAQKETNEKAREQKGQGKKKTRETRRGEKREGGNEKGRGHRRGREDRRQNKETHKKR